MVKFILFCTLSIDYSLSLNSMDSAISTWSLTIFMGPALFNLFGRTLYHPKTAFSWGTVKFVKASCLCRISVCSLRCDTWQFSWLAVLKSCIDKSWALASRAWIFFLCARSFFRLISVSKFYLYWLLQTCKYFLTIRSNKSAIAAAILATLDTMSEISSEGPSSRLRLNDANNFVHFG